MLNNIYNIIQTAKSKPKKRLVVAVAQGIHVLISLKRACQEGIVDPILVGDSNRIKEIASEIDFDISKVELINVPDNVEACYKSVQLIKEKKGDILMKGLVSTKPLLKAVLNSETGIKKRKVLSHVAIVKSPYYDKVLGITDAAINISPSVNVKQAIIENAVGVFNSLGLEKPKVAVLSATEKVNPHMGASLHADELTKRYENGIIKNCFIQGPLALDNAISISSARHKNIEGIVAGDADILMVPDIYSGNILYKSLVFLGGSKSAAIIVGAQVPFVLTSRADNDETKFLSIALAATMD